MVTETQVPNKNKEYAAFSPVIEPLSLWHWVKIPRGAKYSATSAGATEIQSPTICTRIGDRVSTGNYLAPSSLPRNLASNKTKQE